MLMQIHECLFRHVYAFLITVIDKQKALRDDCIYNIENTDLDIGVLGVYLHFTLF